MPDKGRKNLHEVHSLARAHSAAPEERHNCRSRTCSPPLRPRAAVMAIDVEVEDRGVASLADHSSSPDIIDRGHFGLKEKGKRMFLQVRSLGYVWDHSSWMERKPLTCSSVSPKSPSH